LYKVATTSGTAGNTTAQIIEGLKTQTSAGVEHQNTSYLLSMNYSQTSGQVSAANQWQKPSTSSKLCSRRHPRGINEEANANKYQSYQVKEDYFDRSGGENGAGYGAT